MICQDCFKTLTKEEEHYYGIRCEGCEQFLEERIHRWRSGAEDEELDALFTSREPLNA